MPTGYTAKLMEEGQPFPDFVLLCARAMGATIMMRDDPMDAPIPEFKPTLYHVERGEQAKAERARLLAMTDEEKIAFGLSKKAEALASDEKWLAKEIIENARLTEMRDKVKAWGPPTSEHVGLKTFMLEQIETSMNNLEYIEKRIIETKKSFARDYYDKAVEAATEGIEYHAKNNREENERTADRNRWVAELRGSLRPPTPPQGGEAT